MIIRTFFLPTDIVIYPSYVGEYEIEDAPDHIKEMIKNVNENYLFGLTDDEDSVYIGGYYADTYGYVTIMSKEEFDAVRPYIELSEYFPPYEVENYIGNVEVRILDSNKKEIEFTREDLDEYDDYLRSLIRGKTEELDEDAHEYDVHIMVNAIQMNIDYDN